MVRSKNFDLTQNFTIAVVQRDTKPIAVPSLRERQGDDAISTKGFLLGPHSHSRHAQLRELENAI
jgi:hypothetical protein